MKLSSNNLSCKESQNNASLSVVRYTRITDTIQVIKICLNAVTVFPISALARTPLQDSVKQGLKSLSRIHCVL